MGIECMPLLSEESKEFVKEGPRAAMMTMASVSIAYWLVVIIQPPGAFMLASDFLPGTVVLSTSLGIQPNSTAHIIMEFFFFVLPLARAGYMPSYLAFTKLPFKKEQIPWPLLCMCFIQTIILSLISWYQPNSQLAVGLANSGTLYATMSYGFTAVSYISLHYRCPQIKRPWRAPFNLGLVGAVYIILVSMVCIGYMISQTQFQEALIICAIKLSLCFMEMWFFHRKHLVLSPEEVFIRAHIRKNEEDLPIDPQSVSLDASQHISKSWSSLGPAPGRGMAGLEPLPEEDPDSEQVKSDREDRMAQQEIIL
ncbi:hypothetical protein HK101_001474 [Irineochytrium annulatum]|nr:hypothetical protein HK101_001474 [Irineochytrium annulatum]